jgi:hypothetical protein
MSLHPAPGMPRPVEKHATTHLCIPSWGCIPDGMHELHMAATGRYIIYRAMQSGRIAGRTCISALLTTFGSYLDDIGFQPSSQ